MCVSYSPHSLSYDNNNDDNNNNNNIINNNTYLVKNANNETRRYGVLSTLPVKPTAFIDKI
jgi:hypothetical protein